MGIFDDAIREHLDLKRQHGADEPALRKLEDEAFGPPERPGTEQGSEGALPEASGPVETSAPVAEPPTPAPLPQDLIEGPGEEPTELTDLEDQVAEMPAESAHEVVEDDQAEPEPVTEDPVALDEEHPAMEHRAVEPPAEASEGAAAADQPTELHAFEPEEPAGETEENDAEEEEFFSEQSLSDELDQALDAPGAAPAADPPPAEEPEPPAQGAEEAPPEDGEDVLEETPEFLQDTPEHDRLWFEQKPPKDFDFDE